MLLEEGNEGQEVGALQPVFIEVVRWAVASSDHDDPFLEECSEEALQNHGICHISHLELVETEQ